MSATGFTDTENTLSSTSKTDGKTLFLQIHRGHSEPPLPLHKKQIGEVPDLSTMVFAFMPNQLTGFDTFFHAYQFQWYNALLSWSVMEGELEKFKDTVDCPYRAITKLNNKMTLKNPSGFHLTKTLKYYFIATKGFDLTYAHIHDTQCFPWVEEFHKILPLTFASMETYENFEAENSTSSRNFPFLSHPNGLEKDKTGSINRPQSLEMNEDLKNAEKAKFPQNSFMNSGFIRTSENDSFDRPTNFEAELPISNIDSQKQALLLALDNSGKQEKLESKNSPLSLRELLEKFCNFTVFENTISRMEVKKENSSRKAETETNDFLQLSKNVENAVSKNAKMEMQDNFNTCNDPKKRTKCDEIINNETRCEEFKAQMPCSTYSAAAAALKSCLNGADEANERMLGIEGQNKQLVNTNTVTLEKNFDVCAARQKLQLLLESEHNGEQIQSESLEYSRAVESPTNSTDFLIEDVIGPVPIETNTMEVAGSTVNSDKEVKQDYATHTTESSKLVQDLSELLNEDFPENSRDGPITEIEGYSELHNQFLILLEQQTLVTKDQTLVTDYTELDDLSFVWSKIFTNRIEVTNLFESILSSHKNKDSLITFCVRELLRNLTEHSRNIDVSVHSFLEDLSSAIVGCKPIWDQSLKLLNLVQKWIEIAKKHNDCPEHFLDFLHFLNKNIRNIFLEDELFFIPDPNLVDRLFVQIGKHNQDNQWVQVHSNPRR